MATVRIITAMTIDGFLPDADNPRMRWLMTDAKGVRFWHDIGTYTLEADYPVLDLVCDKGSTDKSCIYTAEVSDLDGMELMTRLFRYNIIDELVIHILGPIRNGGAYVKLSRREC